MTEARRALPEGMYRVRLPFARKSHVYIEGRSLCRQRRTFASLRSAGIDQTLGPVPNRDECALCHQLARRGRVRVEP